MNFGKLSLIAILVGAATVLSVGSNAQDDLGSAAVDGMTPTRPLAPLLTQEELDQLVAPVALYDDALLADVLTASTYPLEVVEAHRWATNPTNAMLERDALASALAGLDWDTSVKALVPFPEVLEKMADHLNWTESLGKSFVAQQADAMDAVQRLRNRALTVGTLKTSPQQSVASDGDDVTVSPPRTEVIYVPEYDPWCAYGAWPYGATDVYSYTPRTDDCAASDYGIVFDAGVFLPFDYWDWGYFDWRGHHLLIHPGRYDAFRTGREEATDGRGSGPTVWSRDPAHRAGGLTHVDATWALAPEEGH